MGIGDDDESCATRQPWHVGSWRDVLGLSVHIPVFQSHTGDDANPGSQCQARENVREPVRARVDAGVSNKSGQGRQNGGQNWPGEGCSGGEGGRRSGVPRWKRTRERLAFQPPGARERLRIRAFASNKRLEDKVRHRTCGPEAYEAPDRGVPPSGTREGHRTGGGEPQLAMIGGLRKAAQSNVRSIS